MVRLLKSEFFKLKKEKTFLVCALIIAGFAILNVGVFALAMNAMGDLSNDPITANMLVGRSIIYNSMSLTNNGGFVILIAAAIILCKDFTYGTIRNTITAGNSRLNIFLSKFFTGFLIFLSLGLINLLLTTGLSALLLDFGREVTEIEVLNLIRDFGLCFLIYLWTLSLMLIFVFIFKKSVFAILLTIGTLFVLLLITMIFVSSDFNESISYICSLIPIYQLGDLSNPQTTESVTKIIVMNIALGGLNTGLGILAFYKSDLK